MTDLARPHDLTCLTKYRRVIACLCSLSQRWGYIQFATGAVNATSVKKDPDFAIRTVAMQVYYAQEAYSVKQNQTHGAFTADLKTLAELAPLGAAAFSGSCTRPPVVQLAAGGKAYTAHVASLTGGRIASVTQDRYLTVK